jgi:hypothetical protein
MRGLLKAAGETTRKVYVADTFAPPETPPPFALKIVLGVVLPTTSCVSAATRTSHSEAPVVEDLHH